MCCCNENKQGCQKPQNLKDTPEKCTPEQIEKCHGTAQHHPCTGRQVSHEGRT